MVTTRYTVVGMGIIAALALAGCASGASENDGAETPGETWVIGQQGTAKPTSFLDEKGELTGQFVETVEAMQKYLGVEVIQEVQSFENILLGLDRGEYEFAGAAITNERLLKYDYAIERVHSFSFRVKQGNPTIGNTMDDLCGLSIGLPQGASAIGDLEAQSAVCEDNGEEPITVSTFNDWASADLAAQSGQIDAVTNSVVNMELENIENPGVWTITGPEYHYRHTGLAVLKGSENGPRLVDAFNAIIKDGTYKEIFERWGLESTMVDESFLVTAETYEVPE